MSSCSLLRPLALGALALAALAASPRSAAAQPCTSVAGNLVTNCSFEADGFLSLALTGYTTTGTVYTTTSGPFSTYVAAMIDQAPGSGTLSQTLATTAGATYQITFWERISGGNPLADLTVTFGGVSVFAAALANGPIWTKHTVTGVAAGPSTALTFAVSNQNLSNFFLDDVSVVGVVSAVPEPATLVLLGSGLLVVGAAARRRRSAEA